jgi:2-dehydro-3-deoxygluconokinase
MSSGLTIQPADSCKYNLVSLGEIMRWLDPGESRVKAAYRADL